MHWPMKEKTNQMQIQDRRLTAKWAGLRTVLYPWSALQPQCFRRQGNITAAFTALGLDDFRAAAFRQLLRGAYREAAR
jgi:hypothetical protein